MAFQLLSLGEYARAGVSVWAINIAISIVSTIALMALVFAAAFLGYGENPSPQACALMAAGSFAVSLGAAFFVSGHAMKAACAWM